MSILRHQQLLMSAGAGTGDPYFSYVVSLAHFDGADGSISVPDQIFGSWSPKGIASISATQSKFGGASLRFPNQANDYLEAAIGFIPAISVSDFTIEMWIWPDSLGGVRVFFDQRTNLVPSAPRPALYLNGSTLTYYVNGSDRIAGGTVSAGAWQHVAISRAAGVSRLYLQGVKVGSDWSDSTNYTEGPTTIGTTGDNPGSSLGFSGYVDDFRMTIGVGRHSGASFTLPTSAFPNF